MRTPRIASGSAIAQTWHRRDYTPLRKDDAYQAYTFLNLRDGEVGRNQRSQMTDEIDL
jgi:hypothetical protein